MERRSRFFPFAAALMVCACTTLPSGPSVLVLPGTGKSFDAFRADDLTCRQYAHGQIGGVTPASAASDSGVRSAAIGTAVGAAAGAAVGGGRGAGVGAGAGLLIGGLSGVSAAETSSYGTQRRYDHAFVQCMYAKGHRVPVSGKFTSTPAQPLYPPPPPDAKPR
ncbi:MAG: YMGG-like glycine zipper-containing protein [Rhodocyclaceae bacterium]